jgi:hypothetical protein
MLASLTELRSYYIKGTDGEIGRLDDLCFRENEWIVRYVVVDMEDLDREALLLAAYLGPGDRRTHSIVADVRREQVESTPPLDRAEPLTRQDEQELHDLYGWPVYWWQEEHDITPVGSLWDETLEPSENADEQELEGPQLQYVGELMAVYGVQSEDGEVGMFQDVIVDDESWNIPYIVIHLQPEGQRVLLASDYIQTIDLEARRIHIAVARDAIVNSPVIASEEPITPELLRSLREYYDPYSR